MFLCVNFSKFANLIFNTTHFTCRCTPSSPWKWKAVSFSSYFITKNVTVKWKIVKLRQLRHWSWAVKNRKELCMWPWFSWFRWVAIGRLLWTRKRTFGLFKNMRISWPDENLSTSEKRSVDLIYDSDGRWADKKVVM
jgi:hypothetical protein